MHMQMNFKKQARSEKHSCIVFHYAGSALYSTQTRQERLLMQ